MNKHQPGAMRSRSGQTGPSVHAKAILALAIALKLAAAQSDSDPAQTELSYAGRTAGIITGGIGAGGGGIGGISELLSKSNSGAMVNEFTGQPAFSVSLGGIAAQNGIAFPLTLSYYGGGQDAFAKTHPQYSPGGWVGAGFNLKPPYIQVAGQDLELSRQKYYLSLDGVSQQELVPTGTEGEFIPKHDPNILVRRISSTRTSILKDRCPDQLDQTFSFSTPNIAYWTATLPNGTSYLFGDEANDCDAAESELCQPTVGQALKYRPYYALEQNGKSAVTFFLSRIQDRQETSAIWFRYEKFMEDVVGSCNSVNATPTFTTKVDRALYLKEIYSTNGTGIGDFQTSRISFINVVKSEEPTFPPLDANPAAFYDNRKLTGIQTYERGNLINTLSFQYASQLGRMVLQSIETSAPPFSTSKSVLHLDYAPGSLRIASIRDAFGRVVEYGYGHVEAGAINGNNGNRNFQEMDFPDPIPTDGIAFPYANTRIAYAGQIGNKFYVELENWGQGCIGTGSEIFREHLYEYENNGTYWALKRVIHAPVIRSPTAMDFFMSPDGKYFIWTYSSGPDITKIAVYDLTTDSDQPAPVIFDYPNTGGASQRTDIYAYPDWFVVHNPVFARNLSFYTKNASGQWTTDCPPDILPSTYSAPSALSPRSNNYSGENEGVEPGSCLTFGEGIRVTPGPDFLVANNVNLGILHIFANNGGIKDFVRGLETTTPLLPKFTPDQAGDGDLHPLDRPWFRRTTSGVKYHNNSERQFDRVGVSENLILIQYATGKDIWKYLYVLGWDGNQLRYLYDEPLLADMDGDDGPDELGFSVGPDYFIVKNQYAGAGSRKGFFFYKVDLKAWKVVPPNATAWPPATLLPVPNFTTVGAEDWGVKAYSDFFFIEKMANRTEGTAYSPALVSSGANSGNDDVGGIFYKSLNASMVFQLDGNRNPVDITQDFIRAGTAGNINTSNFTAQGDRILGVDTYPNPRPGTSNPVLTTQYQCWRRNADPNASQKWSGVQVPLYWTGTDQYQSTRLVSGGVITTTFTKNSSEESLRKLLFYPDRFDLVQGTLDPMVQVLGSVVVTSVKVKTGGSSSTGHQILEMTLSYPTESPDGTPGAILKNHQSGVPNFKFARKEFTEGAQVTAFYRDELGAKVPAKDNALIGSLIQTWSLPDKASYRKPGGFWNTTLSITATVPGKPSTVYAVRKLRDSTRAFFHNAYRGASAYLTDYDARNGNPKISVSKVAGKYRVTLDQYQHDLVPGFTGPGDLMRQRSVFQFSSDPCAHTADAPDPCGNLNATWFTDERMPNILSSSILTYNSAHRLDGVYEWRPDALGSVYPSLNGDPAATGTGWKWVKVRANTKWQDHAVALCKSDMVVESETMGVFATSFIGGPECSLLGTVYNSALGTAALLTGEEEILSAQCPPGIPCMGAFGRWEAAGSTLQSQVVHTGNHAIKTTNLFGPTINLKLRETAGFMDRKKGFMVSAWILATTNSHPAFVVEFRNSANDVVYSIDAVQEYIAAKGGFPADRWVKVERLIPYQELTGTGIFGSVPSNDYLRIWVGKGSSTTGNPVYVDDVRLHPADASFATRNYDATGLLSSELDCAFRLNRHPVSA